MVVLATFPSRLSTLGPNGCHGAKHVSMTHNVMVSSVFLNALTGQRRLLGKTPRGDSLSVGKDPAVKIHGEDLGTDRSLVGIRQLGRVPFCNPLVGVTHFETLQGIPSFRPNLVPLNFGAS